MSPPLGPDQNTPPDDAALSADKPARATEPSNETESWLRSAMHNASDMITVLDPSATIRYINPAVERILGYRPEELVGTPAFDYVHPEDIEFLSSSFAEALENPGVLPSIDFRLRRADGSWRHVEVIRNNRLDDHDVKGIVTTTRDIAERKRSEEKLRQSEERIRRQYNSFPIPTFSWRRVQDDFELVDYNEAADNITRGGLTGLLGMRASEWYSDDPQMLEMLSRCFSEGSTIQKEIPWRMRTTDEYKHFSVTFAYVPPDLVMHHAEDITERKRAEDEVRLQARLLDAVGQAVIAIDLQGKVIYWNRAAERLYGWSAEEAIGWPVMELVVSDDLLERAEEIRTELMAGRSWSGEFVVRRKDGTTFPAMVTDTPIHDEDGNLVAVIGVSMDITELKQTEQLRRSEERFRLLAENATDVIYLYKLKPTPGFEYVSPSVTAMTGYTPEEHYADPDLGFKIMHPDDRHLFALLRGSPELTERAFTLRWRRKDGRVIWIEQSNKLIYDDAGEVVAVEGIVRDVTERKEGEDALKESEERFRLLVEGVKDYAIFMLDAEGRISTWNEGARRMNGYEVQEIIGKHFSVFYPEEDAKGGKPLEKLKVAAEKGHYEEEGLRVRKDGSTFWASVLITALRDEEGNLRGFSKVVRDITERRILEERLEHQAFHDPLTDLPNRRLFMDCLEQILTSIRRRRRRGPRKVAVLFIDLDGFKVVNDSLGHGAGDRLLVAVSERLSGCLRPEDALARFGGDEFTVLIEDVKEPADAAKVAERILEMLDEPFALDGRELFVSASIGIAFGGEGHTKLSEELLRHADTAMYRAKEDRLLKYEIFESSMYEQVLERLELENSLRRALENEEVRVYYQPKFRLLGEQNNRIAGIEALMRWEHPQRGLMLPEEFIPIAEETGLILPLGRWVLREACRQAKEWQERYSSEPPLAVCANISAKQVRQPGLAREVSLALQESELEPSSLILEITEGTLLEDTQVSEAVLGELKALGVRLAIDDFGKKYSSLSYLMRLPVNILKLDRSFVEDLGEAHKNTIIVKMVISLAHSLGLEVVGEGVKSAKQLEYLREMGCDLAQAVHLARPLPSEEIDLMLAASLRRLS